MFMNLETREPQAWARVSLRDFSTEYLPLQDAGVPVPDPDDESACRLAVEAAAKFMGMDVDAVDHMESGILIDTAGARLSAAGYMDRTDWVLAETVQEAAGDLAEESSLAFCRECSELREVDETEEDLTYDYRDFPCSEHRADTSTPSVVRYEACVEGCMFGSGSTLPECLRTTGEEVARMFKAFPMERVHVSVDEIMTDDTRRVEGIYRLLGDGSSSRVSAQYPDDAEIRRWTEE